MRFFVNRDIKTNNFLLGSEFQVKLTDFGEANLLQPRSDGTMTIVGTVSYMVSAMKRWICHEPLFIQAPEMIVGGRSASYGTAADVYSTAR